MAFVNKLGLGGVSVWAADLDDFKGICNVKYPLLSSIKKYFGGKGIIYKNFFKHYAEWPNVNLIWAFWVIIAQI